MTVVTLRCIEDVHLARKTLRQRGLSCERHGLASMLRRLGLRSPTSLGEWLKSWDVLRTAEFLSDRVERSSPILDIGAYGSEILCVLGRTGFARLHGIDMDPRFEREAGRKGVLAKTGDFYVSPYSDETFAAVTAVSVIEHGYRQAELFREISRILMGGGLFVASFDYWPTKIDTSGTSFFGMDWRIFSRDEVHSFLATAEEFNLLPIGKVDLTVEAPVVHWGGFSYTFAWMALSKLGYS